MNSPTFSPPEHPSAERFRTGTPLPSEIQQAIDFPLTVEGLSGIYAGLVPGSRMFFEGASIWQGQPTFGYTVSWRDARGEVVAEAMRFLKRHEDGSFELHWMNQSIPAHELRGQGVSARTLAAEMAALRALAPGSRITLRAAGHKDGKVGSYVWARYGFEFARPEDRDRVRAGWVQFCLEHQLGAEWSERGLGFHEPWEFAEARSPGRLFPAEFEGRPIQAELGKAFLLSRHCPAWIGRLPVDEPGHPGLAMAEARIAGAPQARPGRAPDPAPGLRQLASDPSRNIHERIRALACLSSEGAGPEEVAGCLTDLGAPGLIADRLRSRQGEPWGVPRGVYELFREAGKVS